MKTIIQIFLLLASLSATAQYQKIGVEGRQWNGYSQGMLGSFMHYSRISDDSLYRGENLPRLVEVDSSGNYLKTLALIKEDTAIPSITFYNVPGHFMYFLYYDSLYLDLSLSPGDSGMYSCVGQDTSYYVLDSTGIYTDAQGQARKQYFFHTQYFNHVEYFNWVEGLGRLGYGGVTFIAPILCVSDILPFEILCVTDPGGINLYKNPVRDTCEVSIGLSHHEIQDFELYPNPAKEVLNISSRTPLEFLRIYDLQGNLLRQIYHPKEQIDVKNMPAGLYILQVEGGNAEQAIRKFRIIKN